MVAAEVMALDQQEIRTHKADLVVVLVVIEQLVTDLVHYEDHHYHARQQEHIRLQLELVDLEDLNLVVLTPIQEQLDQIHQ